MKKRTGPERRVSNIFMVDPSRKAGASLAGGVWGARSEGITHKGEHLFLQRRLLFCQTPTCGAE